VVLDQPDENEQSTYYNSFRFQKRSFYLTEALLYLNAQIVFSLSIHPTSNGMVFWINISFLHVKISDIGVRLTFNGV
jgi:hypothetical protein